MYKKLFAYFGVLFLASVLYANVLLAQPTRPGGLSPTTPGALCLDDADTWILCESTFTFGDTSARIAEGWFTLLNTTNLVVGGAVGGNLDLDGYNLILDQDGDTVIINDRDAGVADDQFDFQIAGATDFRWEANSFDILTGSQAHFADDTYGVFGNTAATPDVRMGWNTAQTVDAWYFGTADAQNVLLIAENGDRAFDFAVGAQTNPTITGFSAAQNTTMFWRLTHDQTNTVMTSGLGDIEFRLPNDRGLLLTDATADASLKEAIIKGQHYTNAEQNVLIMAEQSTATTTIIDYGGGNGLYNSATQLRFYTAADNITVTGTERIRVNSTGVVIIGAGEGGTTIATGNTLRAPSITTGGAGNIDGADLTITAGLGTGTGDVGQIIFQTPRVAAAGDNLQAASTLLVLDGPDITASGLVSWDAGVAITAASYQIGRNADATNRLQLNVPAGAIHEISVNDVAIVLVTATTLQTLLGSAAQPSMVSLADTNTGLYWTGSDVLGFSTGGTGRMTIADSAIVMTQGVATTGSPVGLTFTGGAHTTLTASAEATDINFNLTRTVQFATGALTTQRAMRIGQPTYGFVAASTLSTAINVEIAGPPRAGTNATITNSYGLIVGRGDSTSPVDTASVAMISVNMPDIASGIGAMTNLIGFEINSNAVVLGDQIATLSTYIGANILTQTLTSSVNTRTITTATTLNVSGPPIASTNVTITNPARAVIIGGDAVTKGLAQELLITLGAHTGMTASTEVASVFLDFSATKQWATGAMTTQREFIISAPTYGFVGASTVTSAYTVDINRPPRAGTNATITTAAGLNIGGVGSDANATNSMGLSIYPLAIRNGYGAMTNLVGIGIGDGGLGVSLGNQTATLTNLNAIRLDAITYTSTTLVRTVTNPATLYIGGAPVAGGNVTFTNTGLALHVDADISRFDGGIDLDADGVRITEDSDGAITFLGLGNGSDEDLTINLDDTANTIALSSSTGVTDVRWDTGTGVGQFTLDGSTGGCIMLRDTDDAGWTEIDALDGVLTATIDADGLCD